MMLKSGNRKAIACVTALGMAMGAGLVLYGVWWFSPAAAMILGGLALFFLSAFVGRELL